jgi:hypothetical protein
MHQRLHPAPDHRKTKSAGDAKMLDIIFIDAFGMLDKEAVEHGNLSFKNYRSLNNRSVKIKAEARFRFA